MLSTAQTTMLECAYAFFNDVFFDSKLPPVVLTMHRCRGAYGYLAPKRFARADGTLCSELALNPDHFDRYLADGIVDPNSEARVVSTLLHEMCHEWLEHPELNEGKEAPRRAYHCWRFANLMESVGLMTSTTGEPGGKRVGQSMSHYIMPGGCFEEAFKVMKHLGFSLLVKSYDRMHVPTGALPTVLAPLGTVPTLVVHAPKPRPVGYVCPLCAGKAKALPGSRLVCMGSELSPHMLTMMAA